MNQTNHFFDLGYGWLCKHCSAEDAERKQRSGVATGFFTEGEAPQKTLKTAGLALAGWTDATRRALTCPRCGIEETITNT